MKKSLNTVLLDTNTSVVLKDLWGQLDLKKYFIMTTGAFDKTLLLILRVMFYLKIMRIHIRLNFHGAK
ncbi:hypothetical protein RhiirA5_355479 [Rhizophagus irregularis]|uniref:Uncharacterized protein n=2 Tax=Rhizophagus irregularis TaxID=588596 RepID=A0A2I1FCN3_9GLOM|nr:hypothetical protein RhiirA5_355479 [Rhizophagus irregularis]PKY32108.1 hypothetical protein RhiirB3_419939 [Rhizophagus irregularis]